MIFINIMSLSQKEKDIVQKKFEHQKHLIRVIERFFNALLPNVIDVRDHDYYPNKKQQQEQNEELDNAVKNLIDFCNEYNYFPEQVVKTYLKTTDNKKFQTLRNTNFRKYFY